MNILEKNRGLGRILAASIVPLVFVACSGATTSSPAEVSKGTDGGAGDDGGSPSTDPITGGNGNQGNGDDDAASNVGPTPGVDSGPVVQVDASACSATPNEVVMVGDSYFALSGEITTHLQSLATAGG